MYGIVTRKGIGDPLECMVLSPGRVLGALLNVWYCHQEGYWGPLECMVLSPGRVLGAS